MEKEQLTKVKAAFNKILGKDVNMMLVTYDENDSTAAIISNGNFEKVAEAIYYTIVNGGQVAENLMAAIKDIIANLAADDDDTKKELEQAIHGVTSIKPDLIPN